MNTLTFGRLRRGRTLVAAGMAVVLSTGPALAICERPMLGAFDPMRELADLPPERDHIFVSWVGYQPGSLTSLVETPSFMVSLEPFARVPDWEVDPNTHLAEIAQGGYDQEIVAFCRDAGEATDQLLIRWGAEMEDSDGRYPWEAGEPARYIEAYRHFVTLCRTYAPGAIFVWSPKGNPELVDYYPGPEYVDIVGVTLFSLPEWDLDHYGWVRSFAEAFGDRYRQVVGYGHPVIVAEFGAAGDDADRATWLAAACAQADTFPLLWGFFYFNMLEPWYWPEGYGSPDWRISPDDLTPRIN